MSSFYIPPSIAERFGTDPTGQTNEDLIYHCPECINRRGSEDTSGNLYVSTKQFMFHCFRCEWTGYVGRQSTKGYKFEDPFDTSDFIKSAKQALGMIAKSTVKLSYQIPTISVFQMDNAMKYLHKRGLSDDIIWKYDMRYAGFLEGKYKNRIIVPNKILVKPDGRQYTDMFVARRLVDDPNDPLPKYLNPPGENKNRVVFNLHRVPKGYPIIISEGVFSCISAGPNAVATYGHSVSDEQIKMILSNQPSSIYVSLDPDAIDLAIKLCERLYRINSELPIYLVKLPMGVDSNDLGYSKYKDYLIKSERYNPLITSINNALLSSD